MLRFFKNIPIRFVQIALAVVGVLIVSFFAITRTEVGRDELRRELMRQFNEANPGNLHIGDLRGNLLNELYASNVALHDAEGRLLAQVDSLILRHTWSSFIGRDFTIQSLRLLEPTFHLVYDSTSTWSASLAFARSADTTAIKRSILPPELSANIEIVNGTIETRRLGAPPRAVADSLVFDYSQSRISNLQARTVVEWTPDTKLFDVFDLSFHLDSLDITLQQARGQVILGTDALALNGFSFETDASAIQTTGSLAGFDLNDPSSWSQAQIDLDLETARVSHTEVQRFLPTWPLSDQTVLQASVQGPLNQLVLDELTLARGQSELRANGTVIGFPDSLDIDLSLSDNRLNVEDVRAVLPTWTAAQSIQLTDLLFTTNTQGTLYLTDSLTVTHGHLQHNLQARSSHGNLSGTLALAVAPGQQPTFETNLQVDSLGIGQLLDNPAHLTFLNGTLSAQGQLGSENDRAGTAELRLYDSWWQNRPADSLHITASFAQNELTGTLDYVLKDGHLHADTYANFASARSVFGIELTATDLDVGPFLKQDSLTTAINTQWTLTGSGQDWASVRGEWLVKTDSSWLAWGENRRALDPHQMALNLATPHPDTTRLSIEGDVIQAEVESNAAPATIVAWSKLWTSMGQDASARTLNKPYQPFSRFVPSSVFSTAVPESQNHQAFRAQATVVEQALRQVARSTLELDANIQLMRSDIIAAYLPFMEPISTALDATLNMEGDARMLALNLNISGDSLQTTPASAHGFTLSSHLHGTFPTDTAPVFSGDLVASSDSTLIRNVRLNTPRLTATLDDATATLRFDARQKVPTDTLLFAARVDLLPDRNRLHLEDVAITASGTLWSLAEPAFADLYQDAVVTPQITLSSQQDDLIYQQRFGIRGALSSFPTDTLFVGSENIVLRHLSDFAASRFPLGGLFNAELALVGSMRRPEVTGQLEINQLAIRNRVLGDLAVSSSYLPGATAIGLTLALQPTDSLARVPTIIGTPIPAEHENNVLSLAGSIRLPQAAPLTTSTSEDLNLRLDVTRADLFFFELIYPFALAHVEGFLDGSGTIRGTFDYPVFEADLVAHDAAFQIPKFGLRYTAEGSASVDSLGIRVPNLTVKDRTQGEAQVNGSFLFNNYDFFSFDLDGRLDEFLIMDMAVSDTLPFYGHIWASGDATLDGPVFGATLRSPNAVTSTNSDLYIPILEEEEERDQAFIIFADSTGEVPDFQALTRRRNVVAPRPIGERSFAESVNMDLNVLAPPGSSINLVFDELLGDVLRGVGSGRVQFLREGGQFSAFGQIDINSGDYLFTAGDVFARRFTIQEGGSLTWDGDPVNALLNIPATFRTRASSAGLPDNFGTNSQIPVNVLLNVSGRVRTPIVELSLEVDRSNREILGNYQAIETFLNQPERSTEYATSVLLTNTFLLTTSDVSRGSALSSSSSLTFNSVSQLVSSQINRILSEALPNVDINFGVSQGDNLQALDVTGDVAFYLLNERLVIRGQGVVFQNDPTNNQQALEGEVMVEMRLNPNVAVEVFLRREGDVFADALTNTRGAGLSYQTQFSSWRALLNRLFGWVGGGSESDEDSPNEGEPVTTPES